MKVYLAGPMRGIPEFNVPAFNAAAADLRSRGFVVFSPPELDLEIDNAIDGNRTSSDYMERDLPYVCRADAVVVLDGWRKSKGAQIETWVARKLGKPILRYPDLKTLIA